MFLTRTPALLMTRQLDLGQHGSDSRFTFESSSKRRDFPDYLDYLVFSPIALSCSGHGRLPPYADACTQLPLLIVSGQF